MKTLLTLALFCFLMFFSPLGVNAALLTIDKSGDVVWNVLSQETQITLDIPNQSDIEVKRVGGEVSQENQIVSLTKENDKISLIVSSGNQTRELNVSGLEKELVEVEERPQVQRIIVGAKDNMFSLENEGVIALTNFPIQIDAKNANFTITTSRGNTFLSIFPYDAANLALRTKLLSKASKNNLEIIEGDGELQYKVSGDKVFKFFNLFEYSIPVTVFVSASTGEILSIDSPTIFKYLGLLFV